MKLTSLALSALFLAAPITESLQAQVRFSFKREKKDASVDWLVDNDNLFSLTPDEFEKLAHTKFFIWQDKARTRARFNPDKFQFKLKSRDVGEVLVNFKDGKFDSATVSVLNKGDEDDIIDKSKFTDAVTSVKALLSEASGVKEEPRKKEEMITNAEGAVWRSKKALYVGEWLFLPEKKEESDGWIWTTPPHGEFVRIRVARPEVQLGRQMTQKKTSVTRQILASRVKRDGTKTVLEGVPMVDQGSKGYCAVASFERVLRYYGAEVDMHDLANLAETYGGTKPQKMKNAVFKISQKMHMTTREPFFLKRKNFESMFKEYNRVAKKADKTEVELDPYKMREDPWDVVDPDTLKLSRAASQDFARFKQEVVGNINKGIPLMWALQLGLFWEDQIEDSYEANRYAVNKDSDDKDDEKESKEAAEERKKEIEEERKKNKRPPEHMRGGHMRLIVGYDTGKQLIYYTDSWGPGHELKSMPLDQAWAATLAVFILEPQ